MVVATNDLFFDTIVVYVTAALQYWNTSGLSFLRPSRLLCVFAQLVVVDGWLRCRVTQFGVNAWRTISVVSDDKPHNYPDDYADSSFRLGLMPQFTYPSFCWADSISSMALALGCRAGNQRVFELQRAVEYGIDL